MPLYLADELNPGTSAGVNMTALIYNVNYEAMRKTRVFAGIVAAAAAISPKAEEFAAEGLRYSASVTRDEIICVRGT